MSDDFTTARYSEILEVAKTKFRFATFADRHGEGPVALWRHDIDFSPQRALALARIEADAGVIATYFVQLSSRFYNVFEPEITAIVRQIGALGHAIGLHFETEAVGHSQDVDHERRLAFEASVLERLAGKKVSAFSLHNPTTMSGVSLDEPEYCGLFNASHPVLRDEFAYCSDSNGIWRFRPLDAMVQDVQVAKLYALTHPEWWQATAMAPRDRIQRCIDGRALYGARYYDRLLSANDRPNVGSGK
ncbi:hypothetical protein [Rhodoferax sp.]|uniref:hypothetical protein n=1 Tax=Rhodoferax sp. TaxID=50421 RepID=UPI001EC3E059|nr:hypothetical protein [Rhodoferax sp.]MBT9507325.1 hypothetical protein [Rhodoferax sp.]